MKVQAATEANTQACSIKLHLRFYRGQAATAGASRGYIVALKIIKHAAKRIRCHDNFAACLGDNILPILRSANN
jgi:hypothetical protein